MINFIKPLVLIFLSASFLIGQDHICGTLPQSDEEWKRVRNPELIDLVNRKGKVDRFTPIVLTMLADDDGKARTDYRRALKGIGNLNAAFDTIGMYFYIDRIEERNSTDANRLDKFNQAIVGPYDITAANVFIPLSFPGNSPFGYRSGNRIVVRNDIIGSGNMTIVHEFGHFYNLDHTHRGWESFPYDAVVHGDTVRQFYAGNPASSGGTAVELVTGNCNSAGDRICDTPLDYGFGQSCQCCLMQYVVYGRFGKLIDNPHLKNIMSYSRNCETENFTPGQIEVMYASYESNNNIRPGRDTYIKPPTDIVELVSPENFDDIPFHNGVNFKWKSVKDADRYVLAIDGIYNRYYVTSDTTAYVTDLLPNFPYRWSVVPFNDYGGGENTLEYDERVFVTGDQTTSAQEVTNDREVELYPNPIINSQKLNLNIKGGLSVESINIYDLTGNYIKSFNSGSSNSNYLLDVSDLNQGLFLVEIQIEGETILRKLIVE